MDFVEYKTFNEKVGILTANSSTPYVIAWADRSKTGPVPSEKSSKLFIEAIELSTILQIEKQDLLYLFINAPKFDRNFRVIVEEKFIELQNRLLQNFSS